MRIDDELSEVIINMIVEIQNHLGVEKIPWRNELVKELDLMIRGIVVTWSWHHKRTPIWISKVVGTIWADCLYCKMSFPFGW